MRIPSLIRSPIMSRMYTTASKSAPLLITPAQLKALPKAITASERLSIWKAKLILDTTIALDVSWHMPNSDRSALAEYLSGPRIPDARRMDLDEVAELDIAKNPLSLTHMLPSPKTFQDHIQKLGITPDLHLVVYDTIGVFSSPRALYTFKAFGHEKVSILDGGLPRWIHEGYEVEVGDNRAEYGESEYPLSDGPKSDYVKSYEQVVENAEKGPKSPEFEVVLDHRPRARYDGSAPEPRPNLPSGHIPHSLPAPFLEYLQPSTDAKPYTSYKSLTELKDVLTKAVGGQSAFEQVMRGDKNVIFSCGSGMTAAIGWVAAEMLKREEGLKGKTSIYDESWTGYASRPGSKIERSS